LPRAKEPNKVKEPLKISRTATILLNGRFDQVFPLFGPIRERDWAHGWDPKILLCEAENIEEHMVFQTLSHFEDETQPYTWTVSKFEPAAGFIEYTIFTEDRLWWITIRCKETNDEKQCEVAIRYTYAGLNENGNRLNQLALAAMYKYDLKDWERSINFYLTTGERLKHAQ
jgi:hypothetical protein